MEASKSDPVTSRRWDVQFDDGPHPRAKVGFIILATDETVQFDAMRLRPEGVGVHFARLDSSVEITVETLLSHEGQLADLAGRLLPDGTLDVVSYACTSGSLLIGEESVFSELRKGGAGGPADIAHHGCDSSAPSGWCPAVGGRYALSGRDQYRRTRVPGGGWFRSA